MLLDRLTLRSFKTHEHLVLDLAPGVTTLVGPTDAGKSAVLGALGWLFFNRPAGDGFLRHGDRRVQVSLSLNDGRSIDRRRDRDKNAYRLGKKEFHALRSDVPEEVAGMLNVGPVNYQTQLEGPFWLSLSPGQVSKELNDIINLGVMDDALASNAARLRQAKAELEGEQARLLEDETRCQELEWVPEMVEALESLSRKEVEWNALRHKRATLASILKERGESLQTKENAANAKCVALLAVQAGERAQEIRKRREALESLLNKRTQTETERCRTHERLEQARSELSAAMGDRCPLCGSKQTTPTP